MDMENWDYMALVVGVIVALVAIICILVPIIEGATTGEDRTDTTIESIMIYGADITGSTDDPAVGDTFTVASITYTVLTAGDTPTVQVTDGKASTAANLILDTVTNGNTTFSITEVGPGAFHGTLSVPNTTLETIELPNVRQIWSGTATSSSSDEYWGPFAYCRGLAGSVGPNGTAVKLPAGCDITPPASSYDLGGVFYGCSGLTSVDLSGMTSITSLYSTFYNCSGLTSVDLSGVTTLTDISSAFYGCSGLTSVDLSGTTSITSLYSTFRGCSSLAGSVGPNGTAVKLASAALPLASAAYAFYGCSGLTSVDLSGTTSITSLSSTFYGCSGLTSVDLSGVTTPTNLTSTFYGCSGLTSVDLSGVTAIPTSYTSFTFRGCSSLASLYLTVPIVLGASDWLNTPIYVYVSLDGSGLTSMNSKLTYMKFRAMPTLTFDANGGTGVPDPIQVGGPYTLPDSTPTRLAEDTDTSYEFAYYENLEDPAVHYAVGGVVDVTEDTTLIARWYKTTTTQTPAVVSGPTASVLEVIPIIMLAGLILSIIAAVIVRRPAIRW